MTMHTENNQHDSLYILGAAPTAARPHPAACHPQYITSPQTDDETEEMRRFLVFITRVR